MDTTETYKKWLFDVYNETNNCVLQLTGNNRYLKSRTDILFAEYDESWRFLRNVTRSAVSEYALNNKFSMITCQIVDHMTNLIKNELGHSFSRTNYIHLALYNIIFHCLR